MKLFNFIRKTVAGLCFMAGLCCLGCIVGLVEAEFPLYTVWAAGVCSIVFLIAAVIFGRE